MRFKWAGGVIVAIIVAIVSYMYFTPTTNQIRSKARSASVQPMFYMPVLKVAFSDLDDVVEEIPVEELIAEKIMDALETERKLRETEKELESVDKYQSRLTDIEVYGFESPSRTEIPIGSLPGVPEWARYPQSVLTVVKVESTDIDENKEEFEGDVQIVSETANVSISIAKNIMSKLRSDGYSISKDEISADETVELLFFDDGWDDVYPTTLRWAVTAEGSENNLIVGYDPRGIIRVQPIPEDTRVFVKVEYFDLQDQFKPVSDEVQRLRKDLEDKEFELEEMEKELDKLTPEVEYVRSIRDANIFDLIRGTITVENFWMMSGGSGTILGDYDFGEAADAFHIRSYGVHLADGGMQSLVLTNAHVAAISIGMQIMVNDDDTIMYIIFPGRPYIRHGSTSDRMGNPAALLFLDGEPVLSRGIDAAIMVTSMIPGSDRAATLGNSAKVDVNDPVLSVGNPMLLTKFSTEGVISQKNFNLLQSSIGDGILRHVNNGGFFDQLINMNFWFDAPIGVGGVSGSGVYALSGSERGKMIAIRNAGMMSMTTVMTISDSRTVDAVDVPYDFNFSDITEDSHYFSEFFSNYPLKEARFTESLDRDGFGEIYEQNSGYSRVGGMNIGIPINLVKAYLQERGLDPDHLNFEPVDDSHWEK